MKPIQTALLASAFALATSVAIAQVGVGASTGASGGAALGTGSAGTSSSTQLNTGANGNVGGAKANIGSDASGNATLKKHKTTTGSGSLGTAIPSSRAAATRSCRILHSSARAS